MNNTQEGINSGITEVEEQISDWRTDGGKHCHRKEYRKKNEKKLKWPEKILEEIIAENFHNMGQEIVNQVQ